MTAVDKNVCGVILREQEQKGERGVGVGWGTYTPTPAATVSAE